MLRLFGRRCLEVLKLYEGNLSNSSFPNLKEVLPFLHSTPTTLINKKNTLRFCTQAQQTETNSEPNISEIAGNNAELEHKLKVLILEAEVWRQEGQPIPNNQFLKKEHWQELLKLPSKSSRKKYLQYLFKTEKRKENDMKKKERKRLEREQNPRPVETDNALNYSLGYNNMFLRFYDTTIYKFYNSRLIQAMQYGQKLIVDCGYHENMTTRENINCAKQLLLLFSENRKADDPFDLHFCNVVHDSLLIKKFHNYISTLYEPWFPLSLHEQNYLDVFPKDKLVYLTPHCREVLHEYDHDAIFIIGGLVDRANNEPLSLAKAKKEGIRMAKLPLDHYLEWGAGSGKSLTINQVLSILCDVKQTSDWKHAFRHVPKRKLANYTHEVAVNKFNIALNNIATKKSYNYDKRRDTRVKQSKLILPNMKKVLKE